MFTNKNLNHSTRNGISFLKGATFFFLGMSLVLFTAKAFQITPIATNLQQVIQKIILTSDGSISGTTGIILDGAGTISVSNHITSANMNAINLTVTTGNFSEICLDGNCETSRPSGGGTPGGAINNIQFNDGSGFSGTNRLTWDNNSNMFKVM